MTTTFDNLSEKEARTANRRLAKKRVQCLNEALCFVSSSVLADSLVLRNPLLRQAPNRCASVSSDRNPKELQLKNRILKINQPNEEIRKVFRIWKFSFGKNYT